MCDLLQQQHMYQLRDAVLSLLAAANYISTRVCLTLYVTYTSATTAAAAAANTVVNTVIGDSALAPLCC
jgi:hypothetical protein